MELHPDIEQLILQKAFHELTEEEQTEILSVMDRSTYEQYRQVITTARGLRAQTPQAPPRLQQELLTAFDLKVKPTPQLSVWKKCRQHRIPTWQAVAASIMLCLMTGFLLLRSSPHPEPIIKSVHHFDTIYLERPPLADAVATADTMEAVAPHIGNAKSTTEQKQKLIAVPPVVHSPSMAKNTIAAAPEQEDIPQSRSIGQDPNLLDLVTKVY